VAAGLTAGAAGRSAPADGWLGGFGRWNAGQSHSAGQIDEQPVARESAGRWFRLTKRRSILPIRPHACYETVGEMVAAVDQLSGGADGTHSLEPA
jgi:hypothetical protein